MEKKKNLDLYFSLFPKLVQLVQAGRAGQHVTHCPRVWVGWDFPGPPTQRWDTVTHETAHCPAGVSSLVDCEGAGGLTGVPAWQGETGPR